MPTFNETQRFNQPWLWAAFIFSSLSAFYLAFTNSSTISYILFGTLIAFILFFGLIQLSTRIDEIGIHYKMTPFENKFKTFKWQDIQDVEVRKYSPLGEFGGWGWRIGLNGMARNVRGDRGIQLHLTSGKKLLIGTQMPEEARNAIAEFKR